MENEQNYYEIRRGGVVLCVSTVANMGYPAETIRQMLRDGYTLYRNGGAPRSGLKLTMIAGGNHTATRKRVRVCELT